MPPTTPYSAALGDREPVQAIREVADRIQALTAAWTDADFDRTYAPGKWSSRLILTHLAHAELAFGHRVRMALSQPGYVAQSFDQDAWMVRERGLSGRAALDAFLVLARMNAALYGGLAAADRQISFSHPEFGALTVDWILHQSAGHLLHHLEQLEEIRRASNAEHAEDAEP